MNEILTLRNVNKSFSSFKLKDVNIDIREGEIVAFLGPNGAGKTTTIKLIMNSIKRESGEIYFLEERVKQNDVDYRRHIGYMPESGTPYEFLTAREYLEFLLGVYGADKSRAKEKIKEVLEIFNLKDDKKHIRTYSKGMKQKVLFIGSIIHNPKLLILDEPFNAIEPQTAMLMKNILFEMKEGGCGIIFSSHILEIVEKLADRVILINNGEKVGEGNISSIKERGGLDEFFRTLTNSYQIDENTEKLIDVIKS
ncbi:MAG: ABC transporter ATP-binding protein [bacterium]|nr:ABC transporter ATP-binding protein [bacterium]